jgi:D-proline reductase (dithiol) PrdB
MMQLKLCEKEGLIGELGDRFHCIPTEYSQRNTLENDAPEILARCQHDAVDVAILVPL